MTIATRYTHSQLARVLSALDGQRRNPNTKKNALDAIGRAGQAYTLTAEEILDAAGGLLDGRMSEAAFRDALADDEPETAADQPAETPVETDNPAEAPAKQPKQRYGTKQATMIEMLSRPEGATVAQIAEATGWRHHTVRGAIAGALKKKLGLTITTERVRRGDGASGSYTVYRVVNAA